MPSNIDDPKACKAFNENEVPALRFSALMKNPDMRGKLQEYAKKEHSEENLLFYNDALAFRKRFTTFGKGDLSQSDKESMRAEAERMINKFLRHDADEALNLPAHELKGWANGLTEEMAITANMFDSVLRVIYRAVEADTFERFSRTDSARRMSHDYRGLMESHQSSAPSEPDEPTTATQMTA